jgi:hypothetical protein
MPLECVQATLTFPYHGVANRDDQHQTRKAKYYTQLMANGWNGVVRDVARGGHFGGAIPVVFVRRLPLVGHVWRRKEASEQETWSELRLHSRDLPKPKPVTSKSQRHRCPPCHRAPASLRLAHCLTLYFASDDARG